MTALAEINKAHHMTVAALKGSDLSEFNEAHPRDEGGRFARAASAPVKEDPRIARMARLRRRQRRGLKEVALQRQATVEPEGVDVRALERVRLQRQPITRERMQRVHAEQVEARSKERQQRPQQRRVAAPKFKGNANSKIDLNDETQADSKETIHLVKTPGFILVDPDHAVELMMRKSLVVGAAEKRWGVNMTAFSHQKLMQYAKTNDLRGKVLLEIDNDWWTNEGKGMQPHGVSMATSQYLSTDLDVVSSLQKVPPVFGVKTKGVGRYDLPTISVVADDFDYAKLTLAQYPAFKERPPTKWTPTNKAASALDWDEDEHPRDPETGKFMRLHTGPGSPPAGPTDPRIARARRRRRRQARALAVVSHAPEQQLSDVRRERPKIQRPLLQRPLIVREPIRRKAQKAVEEALPQPLPKNAKITLTTAKNPHLVKAIHEGMQSRYDFAQEALDRAKAGRATVEDQVFLSRSFLSGTRRELPRHAIKPIYSPRGEFIDVHRDDAHDYLAPLKTPFTQQEISQMERQLAASLALFATQKAAGATGWKMDLEPVPRTQTEITPDTAVAVSASEMSWLLPLSQGIDPLTDLKPGADVVDDQVGYGTPIMRLGHYRDVKDKAAFHQARIDEYERFRIAVAGAGDAVRALFTDQELSALPNRPLTKPEVAVYEAEMARRMGLTLAAERIEFLEERRQREVESQAARSDPRVKAAHEASLQRLRDRWKKSQAARREFTEAAGDENALHAARSSSSGMAEEYFDDETEMTQAYVAALQQGGKQGQEAADAITAQWLAQNDPSHRPRKQ